MRHPPGEALVRVSHGSGMPRRIAVSSSGREYLMQFVQNATSKPIAFSAAIRSGARSSGESDVSHGRMLVSAGFPSRTSHDPGRRQVVQLAIWKARLQALQRGAPVQQIADVIVPQDQRLPPGARRRGRPGLQPGIQRQQRSSRLDGIGDPPISRFSKGFRSGNAWPVNTYAVQYPTAVSVCAG